MKRTLVLILFTMSIALYFTNCALYMHKGTTQASQIFLEKKDYILSEPKTATGQTKIIFGISIGENDKAADVTTYTTYGTKGVIVPTGCCLAGVVDPIGQAKAIALYNLLEENPGYDAVLCPNYKIEQDMPCGIPIICTTTVTVTARLVKYVSSK